MQIQGIDHVAISGRDYERSKAFYIGILGFTLVAENLQPRGTWKGDIALPDGSFIELFGFTDAPARVTGPEALGLRHLAFSVDDVAETRDYLVSREVPCEEMRIDPYTGKQFFFARDPDGLPIEFYAHR